MLRCCYATACRRYDAMPLRRYDGAIAAATMLSDTADAAITLMLDATPLMLPPLRHDMPAADVPPPLPAERCLRRRHDAMPAAR